MSDWINWIIAHKEALVLLVGGCIVIGKALAEGSARELAYKVIAYIRSLVHEELEHITKEAVAAVAAYFYEFYMPDVVKVFVSLERFTELVWALWLKFLEELEAEAETVAEIIVGSLQA